MSEGAYRAYLLIVQREDQSLLFKNNEKDVTCNIEYSNDKSLEIKKEAIIEEKSKIELKKSRITSTGEYETDFIQEERVQFEYSNDESIEIKEEIIEDRGNCSKKYLKSREPKIQDSEKEPEKKYKCQTCARTYEYEKNLYFHQRYECDVRRKFECELCGRRFKRNTHRNRHIEVVHQKKKTKKSKKMHKCDKCVRSYTTLNGLNRHKRLEHASVIP